MKVPGVNLAVEKALESKATLWTRKKEVEEMSLLGSSYIRELRSIFNKCMVKGGVKDDNYPK